MSTDFEKMSSRFRGYLPVIIDVETGGFNANTDALLEIAAILLTMDDKGHLHIDEKHAFHIEPFAGANMEESALAFNGIDPYHPFRLAIPEDDALRKIFTPVRHAIKAAGWSDIIRSLT